MQKIYGKTTSKQKGCKKGRKRLIYLKIFLLFVMAKVKGDVGQVKFDDAGSSVNPVLGTTAWSMSITKDIQETTAQGDTFKAFVGGLIEGEGSAELLMMIQLLVRQQPSLMVF